jgi:hypothetical protein
MKKTFQQFVLAATLLLVSSQMQAQFVIGKDTLGGKIAYILQSGDPGYITGETHGLIAAATDQSTGIKWWNGTNVTTNATGTAIGTGSANTTTIIGIQGNATGTNYAANLCRNYQGGGYTDWYLPSKDELNKLYINRNYIGGFVNNYYWSSTEDNVSLAWGQDFGNGSRYNGYKSGKCNVRAVRAF